MATSTKLKIIFAGTPEFALPSLDALLNSAHEISAVYTQPDRPAGRGRQMTASPVKKLAIAKQCTVLQPETLRNSATQQQLQNYQPDLVVVVAYGLILPEAVLTIPRYGCVNVHASLLPRWRGAAPIQRAIIAGDSQTGITIMQMATGLDTGDILLQTECEINPNDTAKLLHDRLAVQGANALITYLDLLLTQQLKPEVQDITHACYADKIVKAEAKLDWQRSAIELDRYVRAFNPWPVAFTTVPVLKNSNDHIMRIWHAKPETINHTAKPGTIITIDPDGIDIACGTGVLRLSEVQFSGGKPLSAREVTNGKHLEIGQVLS